MATAKLTVPILLEWKDIESYMAQHDIVEVVRCKDCKNHEWCSIEDMALNDETFFCKWGERRNDG